MEILASVFSVAFVALIIGCALFFGFVILMWAIAGAVMLTLVFFIREKIRRWRFVRNAAPEQPSKKLTIIEGDYTDISE